MGKLKEILAVCTRQSRTLTHYSDPISLYIYFSCFHTKHMNTMIQIRNVPETLHRRLKVRAAMEGVSMSRFVLREIERALERPSRRDLLEAIRAQPEIELDPPPAEILREEREQR